MNELTQSPIEAVPPSTPIHSVRDLRMRHSTLLQRQRSSEEKDRVSPGEMLGFLEAAQALGKILQDRAQRENAQGVMDYWTGSLLSQAPRAGEQTRPFTLASFEENAQAQAQSVETLARERLSSAVKAANAYFDKASVETQKGVRSVLRRMVRLKANSLEAYAGPLEANSSDPCRPVLDALAQTGILITRPGPPSDPPTVGSEVTICELADQSILQEWEPARLIVTERRGFREMARGWDKSGMQKGALLGRSAELESLAGYSGRDEMEDAFFRESSQAITNIHRGTIIILVVVIGLLGGLVYNYRQSAIAQEKLTVHEKEAHEASEKLVAELKIANGDKDAALSAQTQANGEKDKALKKRDEALEQLRKELQDTTTASERKSAGVTRDIETVANLLAGRTDLPPEVIAIIQQYRSKTSDPTPQPSITGTTGQPLADALTNPNQNSEPQPGIRISVGDQGAGGSLGVFVKKKGSTDTYLLAPKFLFAGAAGTKVYSGRNTKKAIAALTGVTLTDEGLPYDLALAKVNDAAAVSNVLPGLGTIEKIESHPASGMKVLLVGSGSGIKEGQILSVEKNGLIMTSSISKVGDAGAPVVTADGNRLVGLLLGRSPKEQSIVLSATLMERYNLELVSPRTATSASLQGTLGEVFVADSDPNYVPRAQRYVTVLLDQGMIMPVPTAQPRRKVPDDQSEVRCYSLELKDNENSIAYMTMKLLIEAGIPKDKIRVSLVDDAGAPKNFLQISLAKNALGETPPSNPGAKRAQ